MKLDTIMVSEIKRSQNGKGTFVKLYCYTVCLYKYVITNTIIVYDYKKCEKGYILEKKEDMK